MFVSFTAAMGIALLCMAAIKNVTGVVLVAIFYGFLGGGGKFQRNSWVSHGRTTLIAVSLAPAALGMF
jgi:hypothetical protein